ncbi:MAG: hypothetical protein QOG29_1689, partial [Gaiellaceae bacterium]|nr:hypothetical protein [Gaiellaceae bacterium]
CSHRAVSVGRRVAGRREAGMWSSGDTVAVRGFWAGELAWAFPHVVVHEGWRELPRAMSGV